MRWENPFHEGELLVQQQAGETVKGKQNGRIIADSIPQGAVEFIQQQPMLILGSVDKKQNVWASILLGQPGFVRAIALQTVEIDLKSTIRVFEDPFWTNILGENRIGMLLIELATRRRLRINGAIARPSSDKLDLQVLESYPNCPKYIQRRHLVFNFLQGCDRNSQTQAGQVLSSLQKAWIESADTFFVASFHSTRGVDVSHRGGNSGFIQIIGDRVIRIPDYNGNGMFNTLGNLTVNPRAGLIFIDLEQSLTLQLIGRTKIQWNLDNPNYSTGGTRRYWDFEIEQWLQTDLPKIFDCQFLDYSPYNPTRK